MILKSTFNDGDRLPDKYANVGVKSGLGQNISPPYELDDVPEGTRSFALIMVDYEAVSGPFVHWLVVDVPGRTRSFDEGASMTASMPPGARELNSGYGRPGYGGARPPAGTGEHGYRTTIYALNVETLGVGAEIGLAEFESALTGKVLDSAKITGIYSQ